MRLDRGRIAAQEEFVPNVMTSYSVVSDGITHKVPASLVERAGGGDGCEDTFGVIGVLGRVPGPGHGSCQPSEGDRTTLYEVVHCARSTTRLESGGETHAWKAIVAHSDIYIYNATICVACSLAMQVKPWTIHSARARVVVAARHGPHDVVERGR